MTETSETDTSKHRSADPDAVRALLAADPRFTAVEGVKGRANEFYAAAEPFVGESHLQPHARASVDDEREQVFLTVTAAETVTFIQLRFSAFDTAGQLTAALFPVAVALAAALAEPTQEASK
ncbi:hypothetical protein [[Mycobacterium] burgundiense]|uniref:Uncharacterized protein n=1 Tax=[Mycobacterium] burgundiense TaxID=3064286 RepID=A0ABM9LV62_9MYCO|nr:hypothetical protein [Mycolicibacterium sp. MU0053]CAJ1505257.1 hypothetical protein MU0053_002889 [Mycolicibacterium sp. MU0053]